MKYTIERRIVSKTGMTNCGWKLGIGFDRRKVTIKKKAWCVLEEGKVIAVGKGRIDENGKPLPMEVKVGDIILYGKYSGTEVTIDDKEYVILKEEDILAIVEGK